MGNCSFDMYKNSDIVQTCFVCPWRCRRHSRIMFHQLFKSCLRFLQESVCPRASEKRVLCWRAPGHWRGSSRIEQAFGSRPRSHVTRGWGWVAAGGLRRVGRREMGGEQSPRGGPKGCLKKRFPNKFQFIKLFFQFNKRISVFYIGRSVYSTDFCFFKPFSRNCFRLFSGTVPGQTNQA